MSKYGTTDGFLNILFLNLFDRILQDDMKYKTSSFTIFKKIYYSVPRNILQIILSESQNVVGLFSLRLKPPCNI